MKMLLKTSVGVLALTAGAGIAMAQTDSGAAGSAGSMPADITCAHIVELDTQQLERTLYFIAGYRAAQGQMGTDTTAGATTGTTTDMTAGADTGTDMETDTDVTAGVDTGTDTELDTDTDTTASADVGTDTELETDTDTTASADLGTGADAELDTDTTASADTGTSADMETETDTMASGTTTDDTAVGTDTTTTAGTTSDTGTGAVQGLFPIPVESVMVACRDAPDSRVSDIIGQQGGSAQ